MWKRLRAIANHPITPLVLAVLIVMDLWCLIGRFDRGIAWTLPGYASHQLREQLGLNPPRPVGFKPRIDSEIVRIQSGSLADDPCDCVCFILVRRFETGWYAPTARRLTGESRIQTSGRCTPGDESLAYRQFMTGHASRWSDVWRHPDKLTATLSASQHRYIERRILHVGYLHNALSLFSFALLLWSLRLNIPKLLRRPVPGQCRHCGYSTAGLTRGVCPECGAEIGASAGMEPRP